MSWATVFVETWSYGLWMFNHVTKSNGGFQACHTLRLSGRTGVQRQYLQHQCGLFKACSDRCANVCGNYCCAVLYSSWRLNHHPRLEGITFVAHTIVAYNHHHIGICSWNEWIKICTSRCPCGRILMYIFSHFACLRKVGQRAVLSPHGIFCWTPEVITRAPDCQLKRH